MRKWIVLMTVFLLVMAAGPAQALDISMTNKSPQYWGSLTVDFGDRDNWVVGAGRFYTTVYEDENDPKGIDTFSYCVDLKNTFSWDKRYTANVLQASDPYREAAWLVSQYDPLSGDKKSLMDLDSQTIAMTLQLAIWKTLYGDDFRPVAGGDIGLYREMLVSLGSIGSFDPSSFFVAVIDGQDQLVAAPVPEPATMLLMGMGLLGLGVVGRKRLK